MGENQKSKIKFKKKLIFYVGVFFWVISCACVGALKSM